MKFQFSKFGDLIYISHLDLMRLMSRAARRAGLGVSLTQGFTPRLRLTLKRALRLGVASFEEEGEVILETAMAAQEVKRRLGRQLPPGIELRAVESMEADIISHGG